MYTNTFQENNFPTVYTNGTVFTAGTDLTNITINRPGTNELDSMYRLCKKKSGELVLQIRTMLDDGPGWKDLVTHNE